MSEALLLVAEGYEQIAAGIRKMVAAQKDTPKKEEKPVKKAEKKETPVADTPKDEAAQKEKTVDRKMVRAFLAVNATVDVSALFVDGAEDAAAFGFEFVLGFGVADACDGVAHHVLEVDVSF